MDFRRRNRYYPLSCAAWGDPLCVSTNITHRVDTASVQAFIQRALAAP